jgi:hypothetical protein
MIKEADKWKEYNSTTPRALRSDTNYNRLLSKIRSRAKNRNEVVVVKKNVGKIERWFISE